MKTIVLPPSHNSSLFLGIFLTPLNIFYPPSARQQCLLLTEVAPYSLIHFLQNDHISRELIRVYIRKILHRTGSRKVPYGDDMSRICTSTPLSSFPSFLPPSPSSLPLLFPPSTEQKHLFSSSIKDRLGSLYSSSYP